MMYSSTDLFDTTHHVAILGGGITGMITALAFAKRGIATVIIEKSPSVNSPFPNFPYDVRTTTFTIKSKEFLSAINCWDLFKEDIGFLEEIYILDNKSHHMLHLEKSTVPRGFVISNMILKEKLYTAIRHNKYITLYKGVDYNVPYNEDDIAVLPTTNGNIKAKILLICEGRNGVVSNMFQTQVDKSYNQGAIVTTVEHEKEHEGTAVEHYMQHGTFASLPMRNPHYSSVVWCEKLDTSKLYADLPQVELEMHLQERFGEFLGNVRIVDKVQVFSLGARLVKEYKIGKIVLIGDAAHFIHPLAGQGLNQGLKDIESIVNIVASRGKLCLKIDDIALSEYNKARKLDNFMMYFIIDKLHYLFSNNIFPLNVLRKLGLSAFNEFEWFKHFVSEYGSGKISTS